MYWWYILQNYNYKLHFQNLFTYHIPHASMGTLAVENLDVCIACDPWNSNIELTMVNDQRPKPGMPFLDNNTCAEGEGGLFNYARVFFPVWCHPWMDDGTDGWKKLHDHDVLMHRWKENNICQSIWDKSEVLICRTCWGTHCELGEHIGNPLGT